MTSRAGPVNGPRLDAEQLGHRLAELTTWSATTSDALLELDARPGRAASDGDLAVAFTLWRAASGRIDAIAAVFDEGRIGDAELDDAHLLLNAAIRADEGPELAANLFELRVLLDALVSRLQSAAGHDERHVTNVAGVLAPLVERIDAARVRAVELGEMIHQVDALVGRVRALGPQHTADHVVDEAASIEAALGPIERDLIDLAEAKESLPAAVDDIIRRRSAARDFERATRDLADRCRDKIVVVPNLAPPSVDALGDTPTLDDVGTLGWRAARSKLEAFESRLGRVERAMAAAHDAYAAPLQRRDDLRGLLSGYRAMAASRGLGEHPDASRVYEAARDALFHAPCDLDAAADLVARYQQTIVRLSPASSESGPADHPTPNQTASQTKGQR